MEKSSHSQGCCEHCHCHEHKNHKRELTKIIIGSVIFAAGLLIKPISLPLFVIAYLILGTEIIISAFKGIIKGHILDENFLMSISTVGAFVIGKYPEAVAVMLFFSIGEFFQEKAVENSRKSIKNLLDLSPEFANVIHNGEWVQTSPENVSIGDIILIKSGERIPLDCVITEGSSSIDQKSLTGESLPQDVTVGDELLSGGINIGSVLTAKVLREYKNSTAKRIMDMVENASSKKAKTESFITSFAKIYTPIVVIASLLIAILPSLFFNYPFEIWIYRAFIFLVISCPCALVISIPLAFFAGIGTLSKRNVLVKGGNHLEELNRIDTVIFDKTGTLTEGNFKVKEIICDGDKNELLKLAASIEILSNHPIAKSVNEAYTGNKYEISDFSELAGLGVCGKIKGADLIVGNKKLMDKNNISVNEPSCIGSKLYIAFDGKYLGCIVISDTLKEDSKETVKKLRDFGIKQIFMLTGDSEDIAKSVAEELELDGYYAALLPDQKVERAKELSKEGKVAFVGDGINDAAVLLSSDLGISIGNIGSAAAVEASSIVLTNGKPSSICDALNVARFTRRIVVQNIVFSLVVKGVFLVLGAFGLATMWEAVFSDVGVSIIAILNSVRILKKKF